MTRGAALRAVDRHNLAFLATHINTLPTYARAPVSASVLTALVAHADGAVRAFSAEDFAALPPVSALLLSLDALPTAAPDTAVSIASRQSRAHLSSALASPVGSSVRATFARDAGLHFLRWTRDALSRGALETSAVAELTRAAVAVAAETSIGLVALTPRGKLRRET